MDRLPFIPDSPDVRRVRQRRGISGAAAQEVVGNMDTITNDDTHPKSGADEDPEAVAFDVHDTPQVSEATRASEDHDLSLWIASVLTCQLGHRSEGREAKIRELQASIRRGTYHVPPELIAEKMLRRTLSHDPT
jgi:anti-sigma28 factor (negative regulator of flagellin synthesis)